MNNRDARIVVALAAASLVLGLPAASLAFPLTKAESRCAGAFVKDSRKVVSSYGKATAGCVKDIGSGRASTSDPAVCVAADPRGRLSKTLGRQRSTVLERCAGRPYPMDCGGPCQATDAGGLTTAINDARELADCLQCIGPATSIATSATQPVERGAHGRILDGVTLPGPADPALARCQAGVVRRYDKLFSTQVKEADKCIKKAVRLTSLGATPTSCVLAARTSSKAAKARLKLGDEAARCGTAPFDAGGCAGATGHPALTDCMAQVADCALCRWGNTVLGGSLDCDALDDGLANASCDYDAVVTTTTSTTAGPTTTTTLGTTTTTTGGGTTTTTSTTSTSTTTVTLPAGPCGTYVLQFGSFGGGSGLFNGPRGIAVGNGGRVYVADSRNDRVERFTAGGAWELEFGSVGQGHGEFDRPRGLAVDGAGDVYVADRTNHRVQKFGPGGSHVGMPIFGGLGTGNGQFTFPRDVAVDGAGNVYVADSGNHRIQKLSAAGTFLTKWGSLGTGDGQFNLPRGIAVDDSGNVYVTDRDNHRVQKFSATGAFLAKWGSAGSANGQFDGPRGITTDAAGNVYVVDSGNHRVQVFTSNGAYLTQWGVPGTGDGQFSSPRAIALDGAGGAYVSDLDNHRVQKFSCPAP